MKLFIDDLRKCPEGWELARTVSDAIRALAGGGVVECSLDHDIAFQGRHGLELETFEGVAWYIAIMKKPPKVTIHTANAPAASRMAAILKDAGIKPTIEMGGFTLE